LIEFALGNFRPFSTWALSGPEARVPKANPCNDFMDYV
ncbi:hypothetical protein MPER_05204, partial [Moniliophthora perniciosa FA553]